MVFSGPNRFLCRLLLMMGAGFGVLPGQAAPGDENWDARFNQPLLAPGTVSLLAVAGRTLYVGGSFCQAGTVAANNYAAWDGTNWSALPWGTYYIAGITASGTSLYAAGWFGFSSGGQAWGAARWDGNGWTFIELPDFPSLIAPSDDGACVIGSGMNATGDYGQWVATISGTNAKTLGFFTNAYLKSVASRQGEVFVAGSFYDLEGTNLLRWDGSNWSGLAMVGRDYPDNFRLFGDGRSIYAGGIFTNINGVAITNLARWDGTNWEAFSTGLDFPTNGGIASLAHSGGKLYASGVFGPNQPSPGWNLAERDGALWRVIPSDPAMRPVLAASLDGVFVGGDFTRVAGQNVNGVARWDGTNWHPLGPGLVDAGSVSALAAQGSNVYVGGKFHSIGGIRATNLARWDGSNWWAVGPGADAPVTVLHATGTTLYAGGNFRRIGGAESGGVSLFDGTNWTALGSNLSFVPTRICSFETNLFVGGERPISEVDRMIDGPNANIIYVFLDGDNVSRWSGQAWEAALTNISLGGLAATSSRLYAAATSGFRETSRRYLWSWQGTNFAPMTAVTNSLSCIVPDGELLYLSGPTDRGAILPPLPQLDRRSPAGAGLSVTKNLIIAPGLVPGRPGTAGWFGRLYGTNLWRVPASSSIYAATSGAVIGGDVFFADYARVLGWDGVEWEALGSGVVGQIQALAVNGNRLFVGGKLTSAGGKVSNGLAVWHHPAPSLKLRIKRDQVSTNAPAGKAIVVSWPRAFTNMHLQESEALGNGTWTSVQGSPAIFGSHHVITNALPPTAPKFFRLIGAE